MNTIDRMIRTLDLRYRRARLARLKPGRRRGACGCGRAAAVESETTTPARGERNLVLLHGTTLHAGRRIVADQRMTPQSTYFVLGLGNRDLARLFAQRASSRRPGDGGPALVLVSMPEAAFERLRAQRLARLLRFDASDRPELVNRSQWVIEPGGVETLNQAANRMALVPMGVPRPGTPR